MWDKNLPFIVVSIQCFKGCQFHQPEIIKEVIDEVKKNYPIEESQIYLTGISMGGNGVMRFLARYPHLIAAAVPIAGWGAGNFCHFSNTAYWAFHNRGDQIVRVNGTIQAYRSLNLCQNRAATQRVTLFDQSLSEAI